LRVRGTSWRGRLDCGCGIGGRTLLLVDLHLDIEVDAGDEQVANDVEGAHAVEDHRVVEGDLLANLHHHKDDHEVGAASRGQYGGRGVLVCGGWEHTFAGSWRRWWWDIGLIA
jgi:hypothetical protein